jgi:hypothetical protein
MMLTIVGSNNRKIVSATGSPVGGSADCVTAVAAVPATPAEIVESRFAMINFVLVFAKIIICLLRQARF